MLVIKLMASVSALYRGFRTMMQSTSSCTAEGVLVVLAWLNCGWL